MIVSLYKDTVQIEFNEERHQYFLLPKKERLLGVTTATGVIDKSTQLIIWATRLAAAYLNEILASGKAITAEHIDEAIQQHRIKKEEAADTGTQIHDWIEQYINSIIKKGKAPALPKDAQVLSGVTAFLKWLDENDVKFLDTELICYSKKYKYVGKLDAIAKVKGKLTLIDYKSSKGIYSNFFYQTALYRGAREEETGEKFTGDRIILKLGKEDGDFHAHQCTDYAEDYKAGLACVIAKKREQELSKMIMDLNRKV